MSDTNVGRGMAPHSKKCQCDDCTIERLQRRVSTLAAENAALQKRIENCVMELDRRASALRSVSDERDALRKVVKGFLDDYASADGMYDMKHYAREFHAAMEQSHE